MMSYDKSPVLFSFSLSNFYKSKSGTILMPNYLLCHLPKSEQKTGLFSPPFYALVEKTIHFAFSNFCTYSTTKKTRLYFLWNITTLVKKNMFELVVKHVWTCLNMLLLNILFTELVTNDVSPCRYYEKNHCISSFFITFNSKTRYKFKFHFSLSETKTHRAWIQNPTHFS